MAGVVRPMTVIRKIGTCSWRGTESACTGFGGGWASATVEISPAAVNSAAVVRMYID
jgi:hypothetical protein